MFKYGTFRLFLIKALLGSGIFGFSIVFFLSLISYSELDPGFGRFEVISQDYNVKNYLGLFGSYLSSYSIILTGHLIFLLAFFLLINGFSLKCASENVSIKA